MKTGHKIVKDLEKDLASSLVPAVDRWLSPVVVGPEVAAGAVRAGP